MKEKKREHIIGVMPLWDGARDSMWMLPGYFDGIYQAGGLPIMFPFTENLQELYRLVALCDGFLFTGGHDVSPEIYQESPLEGIVDVCDKRDRMERMVLQMAIEADKPILGICRGIQLINAALGGTLYQDLPSQHPSSIEHHQHPPYDIPIHTVNVTKDSPLYTCLSAEQIPVNSYHHQAVKKLAPSLRSMAVSPDGLIEAVYMPEKRFLWAVQWHPEFSYKTDRFSRKIFEEFVNAMDDREIG